jgi:hypothetical protein
VFQQYSALLNALVGEQPIISAASELRYSGTMEVETKSIIAGLVLLLLAAGPVFAQSCIPPQRGYYGLSPNSPALTGGGSAGHNRLQQAF